MCQNVFSADSFLSGYLTVTICSTSLDWHRMGAPGDVTATTGLESLTTLELIPPLA